MSKNIWQTDTNENHLLNKRPQGIYWFILCNKGQRHVTMLHSLQRILVNSGDIVFNQHNPTRDTFICTGSLCYLSKPVLSASVLYSHYLLNFKSLVLPQITFNTTGMSCQGIKRFLENTGLFYIYQWPSSTQKVMRYNIGKNGTLHVGYA